MTLSPATDGQASAISKATLAQNPLPQSRELGASLPEEGHGGARTTSKPVPVAKSWPHFVAGGLGGMTAATLTSPLDVLKTRLQSDFYQSQLTASRAARGVPPLSQLSISRTAILHVRETFQILAAIPRAEGWRALFKGLGPNLVGVVPARAINFFAYGNGKRIISQNFNDGKEASWVQFLAAAQAGLVTGTATNPIWLVKTRIQLDKSRAEKSGSGLGGRQYKNALDCTLQTVRAEGIRGLYRGLSASYLGVTESTLQWVLYERMKKYIAEREERLLLSGRQRTQWDDALSWSFKLGAAGSAKFFAALVTYPHEVVRTRLRQAPVTTTAAGVPQLKYTGLVQCFKLVWKEEGMAALYGVRLQFSDAYQLWEDYVLFREPTKAAYRIRNPESPYATDILDAASTNLLMSEQPVVSRILLDRVAKRQKQTDTPTSLDDVEKVMHFQLQQLQKYGSRVPLEMKDRLKEMVEQGMSVPSDMHFINFFDAWRGGAYNTAIELLHRYFDYTIEGHGAEYNIKTYHQYALLHLAVLHADFGCYSEAIATMNECIATARENQDARCLHFSLSWLAHLRKAYPDFARLESDGQRNELAGSESDITAFLQQKAVENKDWAMLSSSLLTQAEATIENGGSIAKALEQIYQSAYLNNSHDITSMMPSQLRLHSAAFSRLGQMPLASQHCSIMRSIYSQNASKADGLNAVLQNAYICAMAGEYDKALDMLMRNDPAPLKTLRLDNTYVAFAAMIQLRRAIHRNELFAAEQFLRQVKPLRKIGDAGVVFETHVLEIELLLRQSKLSEAFSLIDDKITEAKNAESADVLRRIKLLILKARVFAKAGVPVKGFSIVLRAASSAHRALLLPLMWEAISALCNILLDLEEFSAVKSLVDAIMPQLADQVNNTQVLEGGNEYLVAQLYSVLTDAHVGLAGHACDEASTERETHINAAALYLERARAAYTQVDDLEGILETLGKKAMIFSYRGEDALVEEMETLYAHTVEEAEKREAETLGLDV
ncbi:hypothetical protein MBLNU459_g4004t2 [Dothideomycetes sp. NU459]